ncbi:MAG: hypothetical protein Q4F84_08665, partial [Fibrobacter sp.]|nr:hypothetical protein [Fibrobacter sp.]
MKSWFVQKTFIITLIVSFAVMGEPYKFADMLSMAVKNPVLTAFDTETEINQKKFGGIPGLNGIEFRIKNNGFDEEDFEYSLRIKPRAFGETRASSRFNKAILDNGEYKRKMIMNTAIYERYLVFAYLMEYKTIHGYYKDLITLYDDRISVMES